MLVWFAVLCPVGASGLVRRPDSALVGIFELEILGACTGDAHSQSRAHCALVDDAGVVFALGGAAGEADSGTPRVRRSGAWAIPWRRVIRFLWNWRWWVGVAVAAFAGACACQVSCLRSRPWNGFRAGVAGHSEASDDVCAGGRELGSCCWGGGSRCLRGRGTSRTMKSWWECRC